MSHPIVLAHGIAPFDTIYQPFLKGLRKSWGNTPDKYDYFKGIASHLGRHGFAVHAPRVNFAGSVGERAKELAQQVRKILDETGSAKVHIIAHSMGGLDARHMIVDEGMQDLVATLTTIGTPHCGTSFADEALEIAGGLLEYFHKKGYNLEGYRDLRTAATLAFNQRARQAEAENPVHYIVYAGKQEKERVLGVLKPSWEIVHRKEGENDGLVSVASQSWTSALTGGNSQKAIRQETFPIEVDHLNELGWWDPDQLQGIHWWHFNRKKEIRAFEDRVKAAYLKMAQEAYALS